MFFFKKSPWIIRNIQSSQKDIFLTFDDGPDAVLTPLVLDLLREFGVQATFFVIGAKARQHPELIQRMLAEGHGVLSHSSDHRYERYFQGKRILKTWLSESLQELGQQTKSTQTSFRPPAGVLTPPLLEAAEELRVPLILWNHRFFDTTLRWSEEKALKSAERLKAGDIVLLHDHQRPERRKNFLQTLRKYLHQIQERGYVCRSLSENLIQQEVQYAHDTRL
jgi:peptidoglycan/xylan/chitin deacetylase (PgdA/CDA1 family)